MAALADTGLRRSTWCITDSQAGALGESPATRGPRGHSHARLRAGRWLGVLATCSPPGRPPPPAAVAPSSHADRGDAEEGASRGHAGRAAAASLGRSPASPGNWGRGRLPGRTWRGPRAQVRRQPRATIGDRPAPHGRVTLLPPLSAACNVWYLNSVEMESLTGHQAVQKALSVTLAQQPPPLSTVVHFKVSAQGITLTDNQRR